MRLINTKSFELKEFLGSSTPRYAILSHTWEDEEVSLQEVTDRSPSLLAKKGYRKIVDYCQVAAEDGYDWAWVDTCCIDKKNHAELAESINSMFRWYQQASVCHVFLSDLRSASELDDALPKCRWFTRGWTLQELIAPKVVKFYDETWNLRGTRSNLIDQLSRITGILKPALVGESPLHDISVAVRMSWASNRETTRPEDMAYCLLGLFDVNMPMIYGEGEKAFRRLEEEIIRRSNDLTIFACNHNVGSVSAHRNPLAVEPLLALSPRDFEVHSGRKTTLVLETLNIGKKWSQPNPEYSLTNKGLRITTSLALLPDQFGPSWLHGASPSGLVYFLALGEVRYGAKGRPRHPHIGDIVGIVLTKIAPNTFSRRAGPLAFITATRWDEPKLTPFMEIYVDFGGLSRSNPNAECCPRDFFFEFVMPSGRVKVPIQIPTPAQNQEKLIGSSQSFAEIRIESALPESHWDWTNQCFLRYHRGGSIMGVLFAIFIGTGYRLDLMCFINKQPRPQGLRAFLLKAVDNPDVYRWFRSRRTQREQTELSDMPEHRQRDVLDFEFDGISYELAAKVTNPRTDALDLSSYEFTLSITGRYIQPPATQQSPVPNLNRARLLPNSTRPRTRRPRFPNRDFDSVIAEVGVQLRHLKHEDGKVRLITWEAEKNMSSSR